MDNEQKFKAWLKIEKGLSDNTISTYISRLKRIDAFNKNINNINLDGLKMDGKSIKLTLAAIRNYCKMTNQKYPFEDYVIPKSTKKIINVLTTNEIERIQNQFNTNTIAGTRDRCLVEIMFSCGLRVSEAINLKISDINIHDRFIRIFGKGSKERIVPINDRVINELDAWMTKRDKIKKKDDYLFVSDTGKKLSRNMPLIDLKKYAKKAGITKTISPHTLRHSFATELLKNGTDIYYVQQYLGHSSLATTSIYTHIYNDELYEAVEQFHPLGLNFKK